MTDFHSQLQSTLGSAYSLERELGGGGMSRVFLAEELALGRKVVVKVLPPEIVAGVNLDRFKREIQLAAKLQHPHIVPVLAAGQMDGVPYYTMPFVEGQSLRARLAGSGALPITEAIGILRDVAKALAYAHEHGVVHRDIKPDNVLLSGGSATVTDFGIAKAISASRAEGSTLTQVGTSLGTPAYMAPEQAAADPATDHRADLYAFGCLAYELLAGRQPFTARTPQRLLAAHMGERPENLQDLRLDAPPVLATLVMRCLEKDADHRPQDAAEIVKVLETVTSGGGHAALPAILLGGPAMLRRALGYYAAALVVVLIVTQAAIIAIGLPDWVLPGATIVMLMGLPVILFTAYVQRITRKALTATPTYTPGGTQATTRGTMATIAMKASPHVSWRRAAVGGLYALGMFVLLVGGFMFLRARGIGPAGSLLAAGKLSDRERILVTDFRATGPDTSLGSVLAEAIRADLAQSRVVTVAPPQVITDALRLMQRPADTRLDLAVAREVAQRAGIRALLDGEVRPLGDAYLVTVRLVGADSGQELASFRETADDARDLIPTIGKLSRALRGRMGESLKSVRASPPLDRVTTRSIDALRKLQAANAALAAGDFPRFDQLANEAIALDTGFAMAYRKLAVELSNRGGQQARVYELLRKALAHPDRLSDLERYMTLGTYYTSGPERDPKKALDAYRSAIEANPSYDAAYNNAGTASIRLRQYASAEAYLTKALALSPTASMAHSNVFAVRLFRGDTSGASRALAGMRTALPNHPALYVMAAQLEYLRGSLDSARALLLAAVRGPASGFFGRETAIRSLYSLAAIRGRHREARQWADTLRTAQSARGVASAPLQRAVDVAWIEGWLLQRPENATRVIDSALAALPLARLPAADRPYYYLATGLAMAAQPARARTLFEDAERAGTWNPPFVWVALMWEPEQSRRTARAWVAIAEQRYAEAIRDLRDADAGPCPICSTASLAYAHDLAGNADSAFTHYARFDEASPHPVRLIVDGLFLTGSLKRLGELSEQRGDRARALAYYTRFADLWKNAEPELQPIVSDVRRRIARLQRDEGR